MRVLFILSAASVAIKSSRSVSAFTVRDHHIRHSKCTSGNRMIPPLSLSLLPASSSSSPQQLSSTILDGTVHKRRKGNDEHPGLNHFVTSTRALLLFATTIMTIIIATPSFADEYGVEKEAPTIFTGETVEICTKRGPLGACLKTEMRTSQNENDVSKKYFRDPSVIIQQQKMAILQKTANDEDDGNALIQKLRQQSVDNREKNELIVARKTFEADQSATFGPFDRQVLIMNTDGKTYTLLENPVAMRLKKAGFINDKRSFITQPTPDDIIAASEKEAGFLSNILGGSDN